VSVHAIEQGIFRVVGVLLVPVLLCTLLALALVIVEVGSVVAELSRRRGRSLDRLEHATAAARTAIESGDLREASRSLLPVTHSVTMAEALSALVDHLPTSSGEDYSAKLLADFDYRSMKRLERTRILVRGGPALGLMGTLIPLSPALAALAAGNVAQMSQQLRIAFSVTVLGLFIGAVAFAISLVRDRLYSQDHSDLEYIAAALDGLVSTRVTS
jgi:biopolymer transport protein ExbB/TolQ